MLYLALAIFAAFTVILDQFTKYLTVCHIAPGQTVPFWDGVFHFTYVQNTGMAFSLLEGGRWFFLVMTLVIFVLFAVALKRKWITHPTGLWALAAIVGGAVGNLIDRVRLGYVVDMIEVEFLSFPVFNVADCFVVCGAILLVIYAFFFDNPRHKEASHDSHC